MKVHELEHALSFVDDEVEVVFHVKDDKGLMHVAEPTHTQITPKREIPKRPKTIIIHLEIP